MPGDFFPSFNAGLAEFPKHTGETWTLVRTDVTWEAIAIDRDMMTSRAMSGGKYIDTQTLIFISEQVFFDSTVKKGDILTTDRGDFRFAVMEIDDDGDASRTLLCGSAAINVWK